MKHGVRTIIACCCIVLLLFLAAAGSASAAQQLAVRGMSHARVLFAGDSLMEKLGPQVQPTLAKHLQWTCLPIGKKSTGLCRPDFYNWPVVLEKNLKSFRPHLVVMWVGTNDNQNVHGVKTGGLLTPEWQKAYYRKMYEIISLCQKYKAKLIFIGPPTVGDPKVDAELRQINQVMKRMCQHHRIPFLDVRPIFADRKGRYVQRLQNWEGQWVDIRTKDQVHITDAGNNLVMQQLYPLMLQTLNGSSAKRSSSASSIRGGAQRAR